MNWMVKQEKNNGITLIALVITIIILLILAGITISTLTGENGLLTKANTAKNETAKKSAEEKVKIAVAGSFGENGEIDLEDLNTNLRQVEGLTDILYNDASIMSSNKIEKLPIDVVVDGYLIEINEMGKVSLKAIKPVVNYSLNPTEPVPEGTKVTVTITATISGGETITKITKPNGEVETNKSTTTFDVTESEYYTVTVEGSNGETTTCIVKVTNIGNAEIFSDIYTETKTYIDQNGNTARIPEGFAVGETNTINMIENGLVVTDKIDEFHRSTGNEFVWIPVENKKDFVREPGYCNGSIQESLPAGSWGDTSEPYSNGIQKEKDLYDAMYNSVVNSKNKGFYMGRYETGQESAVPVVKKGVPIYDNISWGNISQLTGGAFDLAMNFARDKSYGEKVTSCMSFGIQWDTTLKFFEDEEYVKDSSGRGWYTAPLKPAGTDIDELASNRLKNIYNMAGNAMEMTMEAQWSNTLKRMYRTPRGGGISWGPGSTYPVSYRSYTNGSAQGSMGFRITLFFKE